MQISTVEERLRGVERALTLGSLSLRTIASGDDLDTLTDDDRAAALDHVGALLDAALDDARAIARALPTTMMVADAGDGADAVDVRLAADLVEPIASIANALQTAEPLVVRMQARKRRPADAKDVETLAAMLRAATLGLRSLQPSGRNVRDAR